MKVISFLNPKGGSGKTTVTINVSTSIAKRHRVAVVDTDPQQSLANWNRAEKANFDVFTAASEKDVYTIRKELADYDYVMIDGAGALSVITAAAVMVSDLVIIPVTPSPLDFSASGAVISVLEAQSYSRPVECRFLITRKIEQATMLGILRESITATGIPSLKTSITQRQSYVKSVLDGETVFDTNDGAAKGEIEVLAGEILKLID
ncbi:ParA family protein [Cronobacter sp. EKM101R]|uniref:ParA family protein n=1 Tax=Cronobacter TaxID=413496 RepID=UPI0013EAF973|nr:MULTISPECIES: ParA family protein [Cronobacter]KAF6590656.1 ParA family protein [Cronobacter sp. EKM101R]KAF6593202.1 ParA family protein [Cronobacter sp. EKM102R]MDK1192426.1 ParA family protein [Cronobacter dublinensis]MDK1203905.1 ParA family protein [Cronobacter dublinensis]MDK1237670.1 ParA family protein [Cronobacter turicensis]